MKNFLINICLFVVPFLLLVFTFVWVYEIPKRQAIKGGTHRKLLKWNAIKSSNEFDVIILGSSRGYFAYNPMIIDSIANTNTYNMCTGAQNIIESYYVLKEILKYQKPDFVILEMFLPAFENSPDYSHTLANAEFMSSSGKWDMILNGFKSEGLLQILLPILKYKPYLKKDIRRILQSKKTNTDDSFWIDGYLFTDYIIDSTVINNFPPIYSFKNTNVSIDHIDHNLSLLDELCKDNNVKLICIRTPYPPTRLKISPSDTLNVFYKNLLEPYDISFFDFNYLSDVEYFDINFVDYHHMNNSGANKVSKQLAEILIEARMQVK